MVIDAHKSPGDAYLRQAGCENAHRASPHRLRRAVTERPYRPWQSFSFPIITTDSFYSSVTVTMENNPGTSNEKSTCNEPADAPPSYEESQGAMLDFVRPSKPIIFLTPDPRAVLCRCGRKINTTRPSPGLEAGSVRCPCNYVVYKNGSSRYEPFVLVCPGNGCGRRINWPQNTSSFARCYCGQRFSKNGNPLYSDIGDLTAKGIRCPCGELQDTSQRCRIVHKDDSHYEYVHYQDSRNMD